MSGSPARTAVSGSARRALLVLGLVLDHGPVSPARLTELSGLGRTAVHRAIHALIERASSAISWARRMSSSPPACASGSRTRFSARRGSTRSRARWTAALKHRRLHCDIAVLPATGDVRIVETTAPEADESQEPDYFESDLVSVLLSHFEPVDVTRITARVLRARRGRTAGGARIPRSLPPCPVPGFLWNADLGTFCIRLQGDADRAVAIRLFSRGSARLRQRDCVEVVEAMANISPVMFPEMAATIYVSSYGIARLSLGILIGYLEPISS